MSIAGLQPVKWTTSQFVAMFDEGFLSSDGRYELLEGDILERMSPIGVSHGIVVSRLIVALSKTKGDNFEVISTASVRLSESSLPEPDIYVMRNSDSTDQPRFADASDVALVAEVSDTTLATDRGVKHKLYAESAIPEYWIVNLASRVVEVYRKPIGSEYTETLIIHESESVSPQFDPSIVISVKKLFPKP